MSSYEVAYKQLNKQQKEAVDTIDGPLLVLAGPGTGKTQLLSVRVAHILQQTDTLAQNILCLTFTENGAQNMRDRLTRFIGQEAHRVHINTYHAFGSEIIGRYPEYFTETRLETPIDEIERFGVLQEIVDVLPYANPLKQLRYHLQDLVSTISEVKRATLSSDDLRAVALENEQFITSSSRAIQTHLGEFVRIPSTAEKALPAFEAVLLDLQPLIPQKSANSHIQPLAALCVPALAAAIAEAHTTNKSNPLTTWKNSWLAKNADNKFILDGTLQTKRIEALAGVLDQYQSILHKNGWYDFDDMVLRVISTLEKHNDLRYSLQEQYQYILLDEFQDTNAAQLRLVQLLSDNPALEGRPNIMAVGDDDQAIYAFQGAQYSNMLDFYKMYRDVRVCSLVENYRSHEDIIATATNIRGQIQAQLAAQFGMQKKLLSASKQTSSTIERQEFLSNVAEAQWIASRVKELIKQGMPAREIAILAPGHKYLEALTPYFAELGIPVSYEKRENILEAPVVKQIIAMSRLIVALQENNFSTANALWPEVLSFDFWHINTADIWQTSWDIAGAPYGEQPSWAEQLLASGNTALRAPALLLLGLASKISELSCQEILDYIIGNRDLAIRDEEFQDLRSPLRSYYMGESIQAKDPSLFYRTVSELTVLIAHVESYTKQHADKHSIQSLIELVAMYDAAGKGMVHTSPYNQQVSAVQLMTVFKAKGLEFSHVFLPSCHDDVWGASARGNSNKFSLPPNLAPIRHAGANDDERLRILYVALTRAKVGLHLTSYTHLFTGKQTKRLSYFDEQEQLDGTFKTMILPSNSQAILQSDNTPPSLETLELNWHTRHTSADTLTDLRSLLADRLKDYQLSPTHLTHFIDLEYAGPESFFFSTILKFPEASSLDSIFGQTIHEALEWVQTQTNNSQELPVIKQVLEQFDRYLAHAKLSAQDYTKLQARGHNALQSYLQNRGNIFKPGDKAEYNFYREGVFVNEVHMGGKVDRMEVNQKDKTIVVVDYKTGKSFSAWKSDTKLHKYELQLYCYKLLIENSHAFKGYKVTSGRLEFIEPNEKGKNPPLELDFSEETMEHVRTLLKALWQHVHALDFLHIADNFEPTLTGIKKFEKSLVDAFKE